VVFEAKDIRLDDEVMTSTTKPLPESIRKRAQQVLAAEGPAGAAKKLGVSITALTRGISGCPVRAGTQALLWLALHERKE